jgi:phenylalanyl-tRNA synthetase beta chain
VSATTTKVLLESANFDFVSIRRTSRGLNLLSEASTRFSKGIHPEVVGPALGRACELLRLHAGATVCQGVVDAYPAPLAPPVVDLPMREVRRLLGADVPKAECVRILKALEYDVTETADGLRATVPPHRLDVEAGVADLIEDVVRHVGYDNLPATLLADELPEQETNEPLVFEERVRDLLVSVGLQEAVTYALTTPEAEKPLGLPERKHVELVNPISSERTVLRQSLLSGLLTAVAENLKHEDDVRLFEVGSVFLTRPEQRLPDEPRRLGVVLCGRRQPEVWDAPGAAVVPLDFYDLKGVVEALADGLHVAAAYRHESAPYLHPARCAALVLAGRVVGHFGQLHPRVAAAFGDSTARLSERQVLAGELDLEALRAAVPQRHKYVPVPRFPAALRDVAVVVDEGVTAERIEEEIRAAGGGLLRGVRLFDVYRGEGIPAGRKSLAYALAYQAADRTLTDKEVDRAHRQIEDRLKQTLKAAIRGKD